MSFYHPFYLDFTGIHIRTGVPHWRSWTVQKLPPSMCPTVIWCSSGVNWLNHPELEKRKFNNGAYGVAVFFSCVSSFHESVLRMLLGIEMLQVSIFYLCKNNLRWFLHTVASTLSITFVFHLDFCHQHLTWKSPWVYVGQVCFSGVHFLNNMSTFYFFHQCCVIILLSTVDGGLSVPRIIINQLKWLDRVVDSKVVISVTKGGLWWLNSFYF